MHSSVPCAVDAWADYYINELKENFSSTLEIGAHHGKLFLVLEAVTPLPIECYAYDLFEDLQSLNIDSSGKGSKVNFIENVSSIAKGPDRLIPIHGDSFSIRHSQLPHRYSLLSIDGSHTREHTCFDLQYANDTISPGGLIILDDFTNPHWLGVMEDTLDFLDNSNRRIKPILAGYNKLFFTTISQASTTLKAIDSRIPQHLNRLSTLKGHVVRCAFSPGHSAICSRLSD
ncbi:class I SAM-dependent methyltransferase [Cyanobium sp. CH-040]|uniref:class I SAM-dependent methyltransferase n=1 Tax=Cyanobium sp. CH-040 TaxID=2823708 RepID=UPI0020CD85CA|nr:class I SAM-dependent methyltransferase [Cyanobium sp. CH-040]MCP9927988.1 class I SAM-dependent methyltransferase [Cyanobium sp. CH-040]